MTIEPSRSHVSRAQMARQRNPFEGRWNWWYSSIADIMIQEPSLKMSEIAAKLNKAAPTISMIVNTDLFQEYLARRKDEWRKTHDFTIMSKVMRVAELSLDSVAEHLEKKKDQVPLPVAVEAMTSALDRLGYGPKQQPAVSVQVTQDNSRQQTVVVQGVSASALEEARAALRVAEGKRAEEYDGRLARPPSTAFIEHETPASSAGAIPGSSTELQEQEDLFAFTERKTEQGE